MEGERRHRVHPAIRVRARQLRRPPRPAEARLWRWLRDEQLGGFKFRRQHPIDRFIADFYCAVCRLVIELDGESHETRAEYDAERTAWLERTGHHVLRFTNADVNRHLESVLEAILQECERRR